MLRGVPFGLCVPLRAFLLLFFRRLRHALGLISGRWRCRREKIRKLVNEARQRLAEAAKESACDVVGVPQAAIRGRSLRYW